MLAELDTVPVARELCSEVELENWKEWLVKLDSCLVVVEDCSVGTETVVSIAAVVDVTGTFQDN